MTQKPPIDWNKIDRLVPNAARQGLGGKTHGKPETDLDYAGHEVAMRRRTHAIVENWCASYEGEQQSFGSVAIFAETKIRESLSVLASSTSSTSSSIRIALCLDALWRVGALYLYEWFVPRTTGSLVTGPSHAHMGRNRMICSAN